MSQAYNELTYNTEGYSTTNNSPSTIPAVDESYNAFQYNGQQYNFESSVTLINLPSDLVGIVDTVSKTIVMLPITDSLSLGDVLRKGVNSTKNEFLGLDTHLTRRVNSKGLAENIDLDLWLSIDKNDNNPSFTESS